MPSTGGREAEVAALAQAQLSVLQLGRRARRGGQGAESQRFEPRSSDSKTAHSLDMVLTAAQ